MSRAGRRVSTIDDLISTSSPSPFQCPPGSVHACQSPSTLFILLAGFVTSSAAASRTPWRACRSSSRRGSAGPVEPIAKGTLLGQKSLGLPDLERVLGGAPFLNTPDPSWRCWSACSTASCAPAATQIRAGEQPKPPDHRTVSAHQLTPQPRARRCCWARPARPKHHLLALTLKISSRLQVTTSGKMVSGSTHSTAETLNCRSRAAASAWPLAQAGIWWRWHVEGT